MIDQAKREDAETIMPLLLSAIGSIANTLSGSDDAEQTRGILADLFRQEHNRISYRNMIVDRRDGDIAGMLICYKGDDASELDEPIRDRLLRLHGRSYADALVPECLPGDFYLDAVAVSPAHQGKGIATSLIEAFEERGSQERCKRLSLIVEAYNVRAYALYKKLGYRDDGKLQVSGSSYTRMIKPL